MAPPRSVAKREKGRRERKIKETAAAAAAASNASQDSSLSLDVIQQSVLVRFGETI
jgi:hypothetical protein